MPAGFEARSSRRSSVLRHRSQLLGQPLDGLLEAAGLEVGQAMRARQGAAPGRRLGRRPARQPGVSVWFSGKSVHPHSRQARGSSWPIGALQKSEQEACQTDKAFKGRLIGEPAPASEIAKQMLQALPKVGLWVPLCESKAKALDLRKEDANA